MVFGGTSRDSDRALTLYRSQLVTAVHIIFSSRYNVNVSLLFHIINQVAEIRNELAHMAVKTNMNIDPVKVQDYFKAIDDLVCWLQAMYPAFFQTGQRDLRKAIQQVRRSFKYTKGNLSSLS